jgi:AraC-like DNA-binding protein
MFSSMPDAAGAAISAERVESSLHARRWSFNREASRETRQIVVLTDGTAEAETNRTPYALVAPAVLWLGTCQPGWLRTEAGATGFLARLENSILADTIGDQPEAVALRYVVDRDFVLSLAGEIGPRAVIVAALDAIAGELRQPQRGSNLLLAAHLKIILVTMTRLLGVEDAAFASRREKSGILQRFRQLVEMNFRSHWTIAGYAAALGIPHDRLHAICTRDVGKSPKALVSERLAREAGLRLERSPLTIQQLSHSLGFRDPAHFSNFFKRTTGMAPGHYRKFMRSVGAKAETDSPTSFADWP